jgi:hypothetical protein
MEFNIMTEDKFEKIKNLHFTAKQLQLCKETDVDIEQERKAFIQWHLDRNKTRKSPSMAFTRWLHKNNKIETYLAEKKVLEKDVLKEGLEQTKKLIEELPPILTQDIKQKTIYKEFLQKVINSYGRNTWNIKEKDTYIELALDCILDNLPFDLQRPTEDDLIEYCKGYFKFFFRNYESQYMPNGVFAFKTIQLAYNQTLKSNPNCLKSLTFSGANSHIKITDKEIDLLKKYLPSDVQQKEVIHTLFFIAQNPNKKIFGLGRKDYIFDQIRNITNLKFESN